MPFALTFQQEKSIKYRNLTSKSQFDLDRMDTHFNVEDER